MAALSVCPSKSLLVSDVGVPRCQLAHHRLVPHGSGFT